MKPTSFKETNHLLCAGNNPGTGDLPIARSIMTVNGRPVPCIISCWKLSPEELELIQQTGKIWISVMGMSTPPICPMVSHPFDDLDIKPIEI